MDNQNNTQGFKFTKKIFLSAGLVLLLLVGLIVTIYLVGQKQIFKPKAYDLPSGPETSLSLVSPSSVKPGAEVKVQLLVRSDSEAANLFSARMKFPADILQVKEIITSRESDVKGVSIAQAENCTFSGCGGKGCNSTQRFVSGSKCWTDFSSWFGGDGCYEDRSCGSSIGYEPNAVPAGTPTPGPDAPTPINFKFFIKNWVENIYDNEQGTISLVGGVPNPGFATQTGSESGLMAEIVFTTLKEGTVNIILGDDSAIFSNQNNINILSKKRNASIEINKDIAGDDLSDLDITYIERTPRYNRYCLTEPYPNDIPTLCPGTENQKRWPDEGEEVKYTAHILNKGKASSGIFEYQWLVDGKLVKSGTHQSLSPQTVQQSQEGKEELSLKWSKKPSSIEFKIDPQGKINDSSRENNSLAIKSNDLTISIWVEKGLYDIFNSSENLWGTRSFEDWIQAQFKQMNSSLAAAKYASYAPQGILNTVRIDKIVVAEELDGDNSPKKSDSDKYLIDGSWQFVDSDPQNKNGERGEWQKYADSYIKTIDWGLIHELAHQLGVIDLYRLNLANDPENNNRIQVKDLEGNIIKVSKLPTYAWEQVLFSNGGIMGGGNTSPYNDSTFFEDHTAAALNQNFGQRRGYYGEYLFDTPSQNLIKIVDEKKKPLAGVKVEFFQKDARTEIFDNSPEISGVTNEEGLLVLPNREVSKAVTATGHTLKPNPFGQIVVIGTNGTMLVRAVKENKEFYGWLLLTDLNLAYWRGEKDSAVYGFQLDSAKSALTRVPLGSVDGLKGDINSDNTVALTDLSVLFSRWGKRGSEAGKADINSDGTVNSIDYSMMVKILIENRVIKSMLEIDGLH